MRFAEDQPGKEPAIGDIRRGGYRPRGFGDVGFDSHQVMEKKERTNGPQHATGGGHDRHGSLLHAGERATGKDTFGDFFSGHAKKEHHKDVVDDEMEAKF